MSTLVGVPGERDDDLFDTTSLRFEFDDEGRREPVTETVELQRQTLASGPPAKRRPTRSLAVLAAGAVALGVASFLIVDAVRSDDTPAPAAQSTTTQPATSAAATTEATSVPATTSAVGTLVPLAPEDEGEDVRRLQEALATLGYSTGEADGIYGDATVAAVAAFQLSVGLVEDGVAGPETIAALNEALASG
jgi:hypothetical protein